MRFYTYNKYFKTVIEKVTPKFEEPKALQFMNLFKKEKFAANILKDNSASQYIGNFLTEASRGVTTKLSIMPKLKEKFSLALSKNKE